MQREYRWIQECPCTSFFDLLLKRKKTPAFREDIDCERFRWKKIYIKHRARYYFKKRSAAEKS